MSVAPIHFAVREATAADDAALAALWRDCGLITAWNPPQADIERLRETGHGALLVGAEALGEVVASTMVGHDGHRGWLYYVAVRPDRQRRGYGRRMVAAAEAWLAERGMPKCQLMVRATNRPAEGFYRALGYGLNAHNVMHRWLQAPAAADPAGKREVTVTYLEMEAPPAALPLPVPAVPHAILRLHEPDPVFYRFLHDTIGRQWLWYERRLLDRAGLCAVIHDPRVEVFVLYVRGNPAGFMEIDRRRDRVADIRFLGLMDGFKGRGLGRYLLGWSIRQAWQGDTAKVTVNTCSFDDPRALAMYQRAGFVAVRRETATIDDPAAVIRRLDADYAELGPPPH
ncbi:MAG: GNAT family acetyltransferase [Alphaproteobacteria bacterium]